MQDFIKLFSSVWGTLLAIPPLVVLGFAYLFARRCLSKILKTTPDIINDPSIGNDIVNSSLCDPNNNALTLAMNYVADLIKAYPKTYVFGTASIALIITIFIFLREN